MKVIVKNIEYFEWENPEELIKEKQKNNCDGKISMDQIQDLIDNHFDTENLSVAKISENYYQITDVA